MASRSALPQTHELATHTDEILKVLGKAQQFMEKLRASTAKGAQETLIL